MREFAQHYFHVLPLTPALSPKGEREWWSANQTSFNATLPFWRLISVADTLAAAKNGDSL